MGTYQVGLLVAAQQVSNQGSRVSRDNKDFLCETVRALNEYYCVAKLGAGLARAGNRGRGLRTVDIVVKIGHFAGSRRPR